MIPECFSGYRLYLSRVERERTGVRDWNIFNRPTSLLVMIKKKFGFGRKPIVMFSVLCLTCCNEPILFLISKTFSQSLGFFFSHISDCFSPFFVFSKFLYIIPTTIAVRTTLANKNKKKHKPNNCCTRTNCELQRQEQHHILKISLVERGKISVLHVQHAL